MPRGLGREERSLTAEPVLPGGTEADARAAFERLQNIPGGAELTEGPEKARLLGEQQREGPRWGFSELEPGCRLPKQQQGPHFTQRRALDPKDMR